MKVVMEHGALHANMGVWAEQEIGIKWDEPNMFHFMGTKD